MNESIAQSINVFDQALSLVVTVLKQVFTDTDFVIQDLLILEPMWFVQK